MLFTKQCRLLNMNMKVNFLPRGNSEMVSSKDKACGKFSQIVLQVYPKVTISF